MRRYTATCREIGEKVVCHFIEGNRRVNDRWFGQAECQPQYGVSKDRSLPSMRKCGNADDVFISGVLVKGRLFGGALLASLAWSSSTSIVKLPAVLHRECSEVQL